MTVKPETPATSHHTPGPYEVRIASTCSGAWPEIVQVGADEDDERVGRCATAFVFDYERFGTGTLAVKYDERPDCFVPTENSAEVLANARLFAASPDLLDALKELLAISVTDDWNGSGRLDDALVAARAAVEKATCWSADPLAPPSGEAPVPLHARTRSPRAMNILRESYKRALRRNGRKHADQLHECYLCGKLCRGNGGITSHSRACYKRNGLEWFPAAEHSWVVRHHPDEYRRYRAGEDAVRYRLQPEKRPPALR